GEKVIPISAKIDEELLSLKKEAENDLQAIQTRHDQLSKEADEYYDKIRAFIDAFVAANRGRGGFIPRSPDSDKRDIVMSKLERLGVLRCLAWERENVVKEIIDMRNCYQEKKRNALPDSLSPNFLVTDQLNYRELVNRGYYPKCSAAS